MERERKQDKHVKHAVHNHGDGTSTETGRGTDGRTGEDQRLGAV